jgi:hypothetical protein
MRALSFSPSKASKERGPITLNNIDKKVGRTKGITDRYMMSCAKLASLLLK